MAEESDPKMTKFGYRDVPTDEKETLVASVFNNVAIKYDLMNDLMSFGLHRLWKRYTISQAALRPGQRVLDVAAGTGDLSKALAKAVAPNGHVFITDINERMLDIGRNRLTNAGIVANVSYILANAEALPFPDDYFDCITIAFGLRNVTNKSAALNSFFRVLKPGGKLLILEFSHPHSSLLNKVYDLYSFNIIPRIGEFVAKDRASYEYLVESIRIHPNQERLKEMLMESGFEDVEYDNLNGGIVALHKGFKF